MGIVCPPFYGTNEKFYVNEIIKNANSLLEVETDTAKKNKLQAVIESANELKKVLEDK